MKTDCSWGAYWFIHPHVGKLCDGCPPPHTIVTTCGRRGLQARTHLNTRFLIWALCHYCWWVWRISISGNHFYYESHCPDNDSLPAVPEIDGQPCVLTGKHRFYGLTTTLGRPPIRSIFAYLLRNVPTLANSSGFVNSGFKVSDMNDCWTVVNRADSRIYWADAAPRLVV